MIFSYVLLAVLLVLHREKGIYFVVFIVRLVFWILPFPSMVFVVIKLNSYNNFYNSIAQLKCSNEEGNAQLDLTASAINKNGTKKSNLMLTFSIIGILIEIMNWMIVLFCFPYNTPTTSKSNQSKYNDNNQANPMKNTSDNLEKSIDRDSSQSNIREVGNTDSKPDKKKDDGGKADGKGKGKRRRKSTNKLSYLNADDMNHEEEASNGYPLPPEFENSNDISKEGYALPEGFEKVGKTNNRLPAGFESYASEDQRVIPPGFVEAGEDYAHPPPIQFIGDSESPSDLPPGFLENELGGVATYNSIKNRPEEPVRFDYTLDPSFHQ